ncbi:C-type lectin mosGCTL-1-like isoform X1 [Rhynchophorus ferrugineus]|uniref:C-type lectin mosGCTL-1-like isoform X1 n=1 Tax=Rhynchophorus ferrugineus TaxID=354439 RepID=UPI003FCCE697
MSYNLKIYFMVCFCATALASERNQVRTDYNVCQYNLYQVLSSEECLNYSLPSFNPTPKTVKYFAGTTKTSFLRAYVLCRELGMELLNIDSAAEEAAVEKYLNTVHKQPGPWNGFWLSGTRWGADGVDFVWLNTGQPLVYRKFAPHQPDNAGGKEPCVEILYQNDGSYAWNDIKCDAQLRFICKGFK